MGTVGMEAAKVWRGCRAAALTLAAVALIAGGAWAKSPGSSSSSSSSSRSSFATPSSSSSSSSSSSLWTNKSTQPRSSGSLWDRSAPSGSSGGYAKPAAPANTNTAPSGTTSSGGYGKPPLVGGTTTTTPGAPTVQATTAGQRPANTNVPAAANSNQPAGAASSGGYSKPGTPGPAPATARAAPAADPAPAVPSSGGYAKPLLSSPPPAGGGGGGSGSGSTGGQPPSTGGAKPPGSALDKAAERQMSTQALSRYRDEQKRFQAPAQGTLTNASDFGKNPLYAANAGHYRGYDQAYAERDVYRNSHPWTPPPYVYQSSPSFGMWDALFWWMVLDKINEPSHAASAYNNYNDPGFQAWRREADRMAQDNAELKAKLSAMDAKLTTMQGQPQKPGTLPEGVPAAVALAPEVAVAKRDDRTLAMGTGSPSGNYYPFCQGGDAMRGLRGWSTEFAVECKVTNGSVENLEGLVAGKFDAIMVQSDIYSEWLNTHPNVHLDALQATIYQEYVQVLANKQAKVERIGDLDPKRHVIWLAGSGAQRTWDSFAAHDQRYAAFARAGKVRRVPAESQVLEAVSNHGDAVLVFVAGLKSGLLKEANDKFGDKLGMVLVDESSLAEARDATGNKIYALAKIPSGVYPHLQKSRWFGSTSSVPSLSVGAVFILSERWVSEHGVTSLTKIEDALWRAIPEIEKKVGVGG